MAFQGKQMLITIQASEALNNLNAGTGDLYKTVDTEGGTGKLGGGNYGILQYGADNAGHVSVCWFGESKFVAGLAVSAGAAIATAANGFLVTAASGQVVVGRNLDTAVASGAVGTGIFNFANPYVAVNSNGFY